MPVIWVVGEFGETMFAEAGPAVCVQVPVPEVAVFAAIVVDPGEVQMVWSVPALAVVGAALRVTTTSSEELVQIPFEIVQRSVYAPVGAGLGVNVAEGEFTLLNWAVSKDPPTGVDTTLHAPVPTDGVLAARVNPPLQLFWSAPALAVVGLATNVITTSSVEAVQGELLIVQRSV
jgi:hypothetical protein